MSNKRILLFIIVVVLASFPTDTFAYHRRDVLGASTKASDLTFPGLAAGPGLLLPDSHLYFLDKFFQGFRLALAKAPEKKAEVHKAVALERLAEARVMLAKDNELAANLAMADMTDEIDMATKKMKEAGAGGRNVVALARSLNEAIKSQRAILRTVAEQTTGPLRLQLEATRQKLKLAKYSVEDQLPEDELKVEIQDDISDAIAYQISNTTSTLSDLEYNINAMESEVSESAQQALLHRQEALAQAINDKNYALQSEQQKLLLEEQKKQEKMYKFRQETLLQARLSVAEARSAAEKYESAMTAQQLAEKNLSLETTLPLTNTSIMGANANASTSYPPITPTVAPQR
jgi:hypothetical protein